MAKTTSKKKKNKGRKKMTAAAIKKLVARLRKGKAKKNAGKRKPAKKRKAAKRPRAKRPNPATFKKLSGTTGWIKGDAFRLVRKKGRTEVLVRRKAKRRR